MKHKWSKIRDTKEFRSCINQVPKKSFKLHRSYARFLPLPRFHSQGLYLMTSTRPTPRAVTSQSASAVPILQAADWWGSLTRRRDPSCLSLRVQRLRELPLKMLERPLDLFPNNKIVDKTLITIEQIFAVHYEKPFFPLFSRFAGEPRWARATRERGGGGEGGKERRMLRRASLARRGSLCFSTLAWKTWITPEQKFVSPTQTIENVRARFFVRKQKSRFS